MDFKVFFETIRKNFRIKDAKAVAGFELLIKMGLARRVPLRWIAYILATVYHETAATMQPITEYGSVKYFDKYDVGRLAARLGNTPEADGDGYKYRGRGYVQITGRANYEKFGIEDDPDKALEVGVAAKIAYDGMINGTFTGKKLADYFNSQRSDWVGARRIINGMDRADLIGGYGKLFMEALDVAANSK
jgi:putative chitinase